MQESGKFFRGYFGFSSEPKGEKETRIIHTEGIMSPLPGLVWILGVLYFRILARGAVQKELRRLKRLVEN